MTGWHNAKSELAYFMLARAFISCCWTLLSHANLKKLENGSFVHRRWTPCSCRSYFAWRAIYLLFFVLDVFERLRKMWLLVWDEVRRHDGWMAWPKQLQLLPAQNKTVKIDEVSSTLRFLRCFDLSDAFAQEDYNLGEQAWIISKGLYMALSPRKHRPQGRAVPWCFPTENEKLIWQTIRQWHATRYSTHFKRSVDICGFSMIFLVSHPFCSNVLTLPIIAIAHHPTSRPVAISKLRRLEKTMWLNCVSFDSFRTIWHLREIQSPWLRGCLAAWLTESHNACSTAIKSGTWSPSAKRH